MRLDGVALEVVVPPVVAVAGLDLVASRELWTVAPHSNRSDTDQFVRTHATPRQVAMAHAPTVRWAASRTAVRAIQRNGR